MCIGHAGVALFRLVTLNLNGIRSAAAKGFEAWAEGVGADCMGVQEIKAQADDVEGRFDAVGRPEGPLPLRREEGLRRRRPVHAGTRPSEVRHRLRLRASSTPRAATSRCASTPARRKLPELSIVSCYFPSGSLAASSARRPSSASSSGWCPHLSGCRPGARVHPGRRHQHRAQGDRPEELEGQPEEQRLPARGARLDDAAVRGARPGRRVPHAEPAARAVHLVEQPRPGLRQERRLAARLPPGHARRRRARPARAHLPRAALLRPRAAVIDYDFSL